MSDGKLRALATERGLLIGCAVELHQLQEDAGYRELVAREFNCLVAENAMKFDHLQPQRDTFTFDEADRLLDFAAKHGLAVRGHTLAWHNALPGWMKDRPYCRAEAMDVLQKHISTVVEHFKGRVFCWDVANEAIDDRYPGYRIKSNVWYRSIGEDYLELAFRWAHEADPGVTLFYNDYDLQAPDGRKFERTLELLRMLQARHAPVHGLGFQFHTTPQDAPKAADFLARLARVRDELKLVTHLTEIDINLPAQATDADRAAQAETYASLLQAAINSGNCPAFLTWGVCDSYTWVRRFTKGQYDHPLLFDKACQPKPAYHALCEVLERVRGPTA